jgi:uncharacterized membrane protein (GlpM family)
VLIIIKFFLSAGIIVVVSEVAKRSSLLAGLVASLPLTSLLAFVSLYVETGDVEKVAALSRNIFWLVLPSLIFFWALPYLLKTLSFWWAFLASIALMLVFYYAMLFLLGRLGLGN